MAKVKDIVCGESHNIVTMENNKIKSCGKNTYGQLCNGTTENSMVFSDINMDMGNVKRIVCNHADSTMFLMKDGTVKGCGSDANGSLGTGTGNNQVNIVDIPISNVKDIVRGYSQTIFLMEDGTIKCCGDNREGSLGLGSVSFQFTIIDMSINNVKQVSCGVYHTMFLMEDGTVRGCGRNNDGALGLGNTTNQTKIVDISISNVKEISCGDGYTMFLMEDGTVKGCGRNDDGQLGIGNTTNQTKIVDIPISNVKEIICGQFHTMFLMKDGTVKGCGSNRQGALGIGNSSNQVNIVDIPISNVKKIECGRFYTMFLTNNGTLKSCGLNNYGQLGIGNTDSQYSIVDISFLAFLIKHNNKYYNINKSNYNEETKFFNECEKNLELGFSNLDELINEVTIGDETFRPIDKFDEFTILSDTNIKLHLDALKQNKEMLVATDDISLSIADNIDFFKITSSTNNGDIKIAMSIDSGATWLGLNENKEPIALEIEDIYSKDTWEESKEIIHANGLSVDDFNSFNFNELDSTLIRFAYVLNKEMFDAIVELDQLEFQFDAKGSMTNSNASFEVREDSVTVLPAKDNNIMKVNITTGTIVQNGDAEVDITDENIANDIEEIWR